MVDNPKPSYNYRHNTIYGDDTIYDVDIDIDDNRITRIRRITDNTVIYENGSGKNGIIFADIYGLACYGDNNKLNNFELRIYAEDTYKPNEQEKKYKIKNASKHTYHVRDLKFYTTSITDEHKNISSSTSAVYQNDTHKFLMENNVRFLLFFYDDLEDYEAETEAVDMSVKYKLLSYLCSTQKYEVAIFFDHDITMDAGNHKYTSFIKKLITDNMGDKQSFYINTIQTERGDHINILKFLSRNCILLQEVCFINMSNHITYDNYIGDHTNIKIGQQMIGTNIHTTMYLRHMLTRWHFFTNDGRYNTTFNNSYTGVVIIVDDDEELIRFAKCMKYDVDRKFRASNDTFIQILVLMHSESKIKDGIYYRERL